MTPATLEQDRVYGIVKVTTVQDIQNAVQFAREHKLKVTAAVPHSMGGHTFVKDGLVLDMRGSTGTARRNIKSSTCKPGPRGSSCSCSLIRTAWQSKASAVINIFTVGGTLSVNAHGIAHNPGQVRRRFARFDPAERRRDQELQAWRKIRTVPSPLGGYGLMGVILDVDLDVVENEMYVGKRITWLQGFRRLLSEKCRWQSRHRPRLRAPFDVPLRLSCGNGDPHV